MQNKIKQIIHEELEDYITESKKLDLFKIFDLSKIPQEELERQYYDVSMLHSGEFNYNKSKNSYEKQT